MSAWASIVIASRCIDCASDIIGGLDSEQALSSKSANEVVIKLAKVGDMALSE
jgi:hypothetical protein